MSSTHYCTILLFAVAFILVLHLIPKCVTLLRQTNTESFLQTAEEFERAIQHGKHVVLFLDEENCYFSKKFVGTDGKENINHWATIQRTAPDDIQFHTVPCNMRARGWEHALTLDGKPVVEGYPTSLYCENGEIRKAIVGAVPAEKFVETLTH